MMGQLIHLGGCSQGTDSPATGGLVAFAGTATSQASVCAVPPPGSWHHGCRQITSRKTLFLGALRHSQGQRSMNGDPFSKSIPPKFWFLVIVPELGLAVGQLPRTK